MPDSFAAQQADDPRVADILAILAEEGGVDVSRLRPDATMEELGIASIDLTQAVFALENRFDIEIPVVPGQAGGEFDTVGDLVAHVLATIAQAHPGQPA